MPRLNQPATLSGVVHGLIKSPLAGFSLLYGLFVYALLGAVLAQMFMILVPVPYNDHHGLPVCDSNCTIEIVVGVNEALVQKKKTEKKQRKQSMC